MSLARHVRRALHKTSLLRRLQTFPLSTLGTPSEISAYLSRPTWSVREILVPSSSISPTPTPDSAREITPAKLHHLLRLSALPLPSSQAEEDKLLNDLKRQLQFVRAIQAVDTEGVEPLVAIRDETTEGRKGKEVGMGDLEIQRALGREMRVGKRGRIVRVNGREGGKEERDWDPLERAGRRVEGYIAVDRSKD